MKENMTNKKISVRKHLPLSVRVHYDTVRNFSLAKLAGLSVIAVAGFFGLLLAAQTISPSSFASSNEVTEISPFSGVTVTKVSEARISSGNNSVLRFNVDVPGGRTRLSGSTPVKHYVNDTSNHRCSTSANSYQSITRAATGTRNNTGGEFIANFTTNNKTVCVRVSITGAPPHGGGYGYYSIKVNRSGTATNSGTSQQASSTSDQLTEITRFTVAPSSVKTTFTVNFKDSSNPRPIAGVKYYNKLVQSPTCSKRPQLYETSSTKTGRRISGADEYRIDLDLETQQVCIMVTLSDTNEYHGPHTIPLGIKSITSNNSGNLVATANRRNVTWRNFGPNSNGTCNANTFNVPPTDRDRIRSSNTAVVSSGDNGKYYCFTARHGGDVAYRFVRVSNSGGTVLAEDDITVSNFSQNADGVHFVVTARNNSTINYVEYQTSSESTNRRCLRDRDGYSSAEKRETIYGPIYTASPIETTHKSICIRVGYTIDNDNTRYVKFLKYRLTAQAQQQVTPTPVTPTPVTPAPVTPTPVTPAPVTPTPVTPAPVTPTPVTPEPTTPITTCEAGKTLNTEGACVDNQGEEVTSAPKTGILDDDNNWSLVGYVLLAVAVLGAARILIVKKYKQIS